VGARLSVGKEGWYSDAACVLLAAWTDTLWSWHQLDVVMLCSRTLGVPELGLGVCVCGGDSKLGTPHWKNIFTVGPADDCLPRRCTVGVGAG
jgi:hypothetical protein